VQIVPRASTNRRWFVNWLTNWCAPRAAAIAVKISARQKFAREHRQQTLIAREKTPRLALFSRSMGVLLGFEQNYGCVGSFLLALPLPKDYYNDLALPFFIKSLFARQGYRNQNLL
jgi:hypothetical protein